MGDAVGLNYVLAYVHPDGHVTARPTSCSEEYVRDGCAQIISTLSRCYYDDESALSNIRCVSDSFDAPSLDSILDGSLKKGEPVIVYRGEGKWVLEATEAPTMFRWAPGVTGPAVGAYVHHDGTVRSRLMSFGIELDDEWILRWLRKEFDQDGIALNFCDQDQFHIDGFQPQTFPSVEALLANPSEHPEAPVFLYRGEGKWETAQGTMR